MPCENRLSGFQHNNYCQRKEGAQGGKRGKRRAEKGDSHSTLKGGGQAGGFCWNRNGKKGGRLARHGVFEIISESYW